MLSDLTLQTLWSQLCVFLLYRLTISGFINKFCKKRTGSIYYLLTIVHPISTQPICLGNKRKDFPIPEHLNLTNGIFVPEYYAFSPSSKCRCVFIYSFSSLRGSRSTNRLFKSNLPHPFLFDIFRRGFLFRVEKTTYLFPAVRGQVEHKYGEKRDAHTWNNEVHRVK